MVERLSVNVGSTDLTFETGRIAKQAHGAVFVTQGDTVVLTAVGVAPEARPGQDFFPLTVEYREKSAAAGRIPGNYFRREGRPSEREILVCRMTDRPLRPLFPKGFINEVQVFSTVFSADNENNPDVMSINGASAALHISKIPFNGPIGAVRVGMIDGALAANPPMSEMEDSVLDVVIAGTKDAITMVEGKALEVSEDTLLEALEFGHEHIRRICDAIEEFRARAGVEKMAFEVPELDSDATSRRWPPNALRKSCRSLRSRNGATRTTPSRTKLPRNWRSDTARSCTKSARATSRRPLRRRRNASCGKG